jgi:hypothetical protein
MLVGRLEEARSEPSSEAVKNRSEVGETLLLVSKEAVGIAFGMGTGGGPVGPESSVTLPINADKENIPSDGGPPSHGICDIKGVTDGPETGFAAFSRGV